MAPWNREELEAVSRDHMAGVPLGLIYFVGLGILGSVIQYAVRRFSGSSFLLRRWAKDNAYEILDFEIRQYSKRPFTWRASRRGQDVYNVRIRDFRGRERSGLLLCNRYWGNGKTEVEWEKEWKPSEEKLID